MVQDTTPTFLVELRLNTSNRDRIEIDKALDAGRMLFNACLGEALKRIDLMRESKAYRRTVAMPRSEERTKAFRDLRKIMRATGTLSAKGGGHGSRARGSSIVLNPRAMKQVSGTGTAG